MSDVHSYFVDVAQLELGMYIHLDLGWTEHPFPLNSFMISSRRQIDIIRTLGLERIRYSPEKCDTIPTSQSTTPSPPAPMAGQERLRKVSEKQKRRQLLAAQQSSLDACERQFADTSGRFRNILKDAPLAPVSAREQAEAIVREILEGITADGDVAIRLLSEKASGDTTLHPIHVTMISLLLGKACGLDLKAMRDLGTGTLLHDTGKLELPERLRWTEDVLSPAERPLFRRHVDYGIELGKKMGLSDSSLRVIGQHHEYVDGSGYPHGLQGGQMAPGGKILSIVNYYDNLCHPGHPALAMTPHDALAQMFAGTRSRFDQTTMATFIRMMGVYPPGSVIQLDDGRYALVVTVNSSRPLRPQVVIYEPYVPKNDAIIVDLEDEPELGIRRSLAPLKLPKRVFDYLSPRKRICYFFERARETGPGKKAP